MNPSSWNREFIEGLMEKIRHKRVFIIGDTSIDHYVIGAVNRISPDAPVPLVDVSREAHNIGGIKKISQFILELGGYVDLLTVVGKDFEGQYAYEEFKELDIPVKGIFTWGENTPKITRIIAQGQQITRLEKRYSFSETKLPHLPTNPVEEKKDENSIILLMEKINEFLYEHIKKADVLLILDYDLGFLHPLLINKVLGVARSLKKPVIVRPEAYKYIYYKNVFLLSMNRNIAASATGITPVNETCLRIIGTKLLSEIRSKYVYISWLEGESYLFADPLNTEVIKFKSYMTQKPQSFRDAGSALLSCITLFSTVENDPRRYISWANHAASLYVLSDKSRSFSELLLDSFNVTP